MSLTNPDSVVTKQDLKDFYDTILPYLGGNLPVMGDIDRSMIFDTTEKVVGKWTDGKPVYMKVFTGTINNATTEGTEVDTNIAVGATVDSPVQIFGIAMNASGSCQTIPTIKPNGSSNNKGTLRVNIVTGTSTLVLKNSFFVSGTNTYRIVMYYTKTTDAANSFNYASENDYSTTEKIIGTWIDGKKLYQKTINFGALPNNTTKQMAHRITNIAQIVKVDGVWQNSGSFSEAGCINSSDSATIGNNTFTSVDGTYVIIRTASNASSYNAYITLQYTKTS